MFINHEDRIVHALETIAECQKEQTEIIEQSFKEYKKKAERIEHIYKGMDLFSLLQK